ncbi:MAG: hypothetical protein HYV53_04630 [Parcubacteria group bacterium]|nr:hypothetical protein [Parcubacteria group bacterium]
MKIILSEKPNIKITKEYLYKFFVPESSFYLIEINARAKSWRQNFTRFKSFFKDDDLVIKIDSQEFPKLNGKKGLFDGEVAWNGNNLRGLSKTNFFVIRLQKGEHILNFIPDQKPFLESITINQLENQKDIFLISAKKQAEDGERRQWNEAVRNYNGNGNINYENAVYKAYRDGADERDKNNPIKLWSILFLIFMVATGASIFGIWLYGEQSRAWLTFEPGEEVDLKYTLTANVLEGIMLKKKIVSKYYEGDKGYQRSYYAITPESDPYLYYKNILGDKEEEIIITGKNDNDTSIFYILKKTKNGFAIVSNIDKFGSKNPAFRGDGFDFVDSDKDGTMETRELFYQTVIRTNPSENKRHIYRVWYSYNDAKGMYVVYKEDELDEGDPDKEPIFLW